MNNPLHYKLENTDPSERKAFIRDMFDDIVPTYDFLNRFLSAGIDRGWRRTVVRAATREENPRVLDLCCGTGDLSKQLREKGANVTSLDFSTAMLQQGQSRGWLTKKTVAADASHLPFQSESFDRATIAFGIRNIPDLDNLMAETARVLKKGGTFQILELTRPKNFLVIPFYNLYLKVILPRVGALVSGKKMAYDYLAETIATFVEPEELAAMLRERGFDEVKVKSKTFGIATILTAKKGI